MDVQDKPSSFGIRFIISAIVFRVLGRMLWSESGKGVQGYLIPVLGAFAVAYAWPLIMERRAHERELLREQEEEESEPEEPEHLTELRKQASRD